MHIIRQADEKGVLPEGVDGAVFTRCATCRARLDPPAGCADHPGAGVDVRVLTAANLTDDRRATVEAQLLAPIWGTTDAIDALLANPPAGTPHAP